MSEWAPHSTLPGVYERYFEGDGDLFHRQKVQDVEPIIDMNQRVRNDTDGRTGEGGRKIASIPATVFYDWVAEWERKGLLAPGHMGDLNKLLIQRIRDGDYSKFRTTWGGI